LHIFLKICASAQDAYGILVRMKGGTQYTLPRIRFGRRGWSHLRGVAGSERTQAGFTIIEVLIVLAVTGFMFISAMALISGRQAKTQFQQSVTQIQTQMQQVISEVSTGYYANTNNFKCTASGSNNISLSSGTGTQGANTACIFLGKVVQFTNVSGSTGNQSYYTFPIAARRADSSGNEITDIAQSNATVVAPSTTQPNIPDASVTDHLLYGLSVGKMYYTSGATTTQIGAFGIVSNLGSPDSSGVGLSSGSQQFNLVPISGSTVINPSNKVSAAQTIDSNLASSFTNRSNPDGGVTVCLVSGTTQQSALMTIGGNGRTISVTISIKGTTTCP
jgi:prepilin-type N-terminal cleavage/methylation domain-containing protein